MWKIVCLGFQRVDSKNKESDELERKKETCVWVSHENQMKARRVAEWDGEVLGKDTNQIMLLHVCMYKCVTVSPVIICN